LVVDHLNDARTLECFLYSGITGRGVPDLDEHALPPSSEDTFDYEDDNEHDKYHSANPKSGRTRS
jgi:hypothetical protein